MSIVKLTGDLTGKAVVYNGALIRKIDIDDKFINTIPHPMENKKFLSEDDIASLICEILPNKAESVVPYQSVNDADYGEVSSYSETFMYHNESGEIDFNVMVRKGILVIKSISYNLTFIKRGTV